MAPPIFPVATVISLTASAYIPLLVRAILLKRNKVDILKLNERRAGRAEGLSPGDVSESVYNRAARLQASHENQLETIPLWASAVAAAIAVGVPTRRMNILAALQVVGRASYSILYTLDPIFNGLLRSAAFALSLGSKCPLCRLGHQGSALRYIARAAAL